MSDAIKKSGIVIAGQVSDVRSYVAKSTGEERFNVRLFVPGSELIQIGLNGRPDPKRFPVGELVQMRISVGSYNGNMFFNEAD